MLAGGFPRHSPVPRHLPDGPADAGCRHVGNGQRQAHQLREEKEGVRDSCSGKLFFFIHFFFILKSSETYTQKNLMVGSF